MPNNVIKAKDFSQRVDLEEHIMSQYGTTTEVKDVTITGTREDLARLKLSDRTRVFGAKCVIVDKPTEAIFIKRLNRRENGKTNISNSKRKKSS